MPKSLGVSSRARTNPMANDAIFVTRIPTRLQRRPRPACRTIEPARADSTTSSSSTVPPPMVAAVRRSGSLFLVDSVEPHLPPEADPRPRAVHVIGALADKSFEHDARGLHLHHAARLLVDDLLHATLDARLPPAEACHLLVEAESAIELVGVDGVEDRVLRLDPDAVAGLQAELDNRRPTNDASGDEAPPLAAAEPELSGQHSCRQALEP